MLPIRGLFNSPDFTISMYVVHEDQKNLCVILPSSLSLHLFLGSHATGIFLSASALI